MSYELHYITAGVPSVCGLVIVLAANGVCVNLGDSGS